MILQSIENITKNILKRMMFEASVFGAGGALESGERLSDTFAERQVEWQNSTGKNSNVHCLKVLHSVQVFESIARRVDTVYGSN